MSRCEAVVGIDETFTSSCNSFERALGVDFAPMSTTNMVHQQISLVPIADLHCVEGIVENLHDLSLIDSAESDVFGGDKVLLKVVIVAYFVRAVAAENYVPR